MLDTINTPGLNSTLIDDLLELPVEEMTTLSKVVSREQRSRAAWVRP
jgi:hypothetical protein